jgi:hypothetical protein
MGFIVGMITPFRAYMTIKISPNIDKIKNEFVPLKGGRHEKRISGLCQVQRERESEHHRIAEVVEPGADHDENEGVLPLPSRNDDP